MIRKLDIKDIAVFQGTHSLNEFKEFNYFFGTNGTGKTTISRIFDFPDNYSKCTITWDNHIPLETRVYNRDFIDRNFNQQKLKGVFTLGEAAKETLDRIENVKGGIEAIQAEISTLTNTLQGTDGKGGKRAELSEIESVYKDKFYEMKQKHANKLSGANAGEGMSGFIRSKENFMNKVLGESELNTALLLPLSILEENAKLLFSNKLSPVNIFPEIDAGKLLMHENNPILQKRIIGKTDVDVAAMITKLNNSDWVRQGLSYYEINDSICPFCQQETNEKLHEMLSEYFDETFNNDNNAVKMLIDAYHVDSQRLENQVQVMIDSQSPFLDIETLKIETQLLNSAILINTQRLEEKQKESSHAIALVSLAENLDKIIKIITTANTKISENNRMLANLRNEKINLSAQIWKFVITELESDIGEYKQKKSHAELAISEITRKIEQKNVERARLETELHELERQTTSIIPTKDGINHLLEIFGFKTFRVDIGSESNTYKLIREDGNDAKNTLSEGEKNFLTFLYFYYLLKGSQSEIDTIKDKIVVIDDPISSLDNDVLFIVSTLVKELIQDVRDRNGAIKQIFILTHNVYFHKEVTFNARRKGNALHDETFWLIRKNDKISIVVKENDNPIKTSYELLWDEVRKETRNNATIQNTLRRILENYFKLLGHIPDEKLYEKFEGEDKMKCKALFSWINDGSHNVLDEDFYTSLDDAMILKFLEIFKQIFEKSGHIAHYKMMMRV